MSDDRFKFRVWDKRKKQYADRYVIGDDGWAYQLHDAGEDSYDLIPDEDVIIEQCTGLRDKNGTLIYEGDVVRYYRSTAMCLGGERIAQVLWDERDAEFGILTTLGDGYNMWEALRFGIEIIGNVHDKDKDK